MPDTAGLPKTPCVAVTAAYPGGRAYPCASGFHAAAAAAAAAAATLLAFGGIEVGRAAAACPNECGLVLMGGPLMLILLVSTMLPMLRLLLPSRRACGQDGMEV